MKPYPRPKLPIFFLLLLAFAAVGLQACGEHGPLQSSATTPEEVTATESAMSLQGTMVMTGEYTCAGTTYRVQQPITQTGPTRRCCGLASIYTTNVGNTTGWDYGVNSGPYTKIGLVCNPLYIATYPVCGSSGALCATASTSCQMFNKPPGAINWFLSGNVTATTYTHLYPDATANGFYVMYLAYTGGGNGVGISSCSTPWGYNLDYMFGG